MINVASQEETLALDTYRTWAQLFAQLRYYSRIMDRFHSSTRSYQLLHDGRDYDSSWLEGQLRPLGFRIALLLRSPASFEQARASRLKAAPV